MGHAGERTPQEELAEWAGAFDLDEVEAKAWEAAKGIGVYPREAAEFAWLPLAAVGPGSALAGMRKLRRAAIARSLEMSWHSELSWEEDPQVKAALRAAAMAMGEARSSARVEELWRAASRELGAAAMDPRLGKVRSMVSRGASDRRSRMALFPALEQLGVPAGDEAREAARALAMLERQDLEEGIAGAGGEDGGAQGAGSGPRRL